MLISGNLPSCYLKKSFYFFIFFIFLTSVDCVVPRWKTPIAHKRNITSRSQRTDNVDSSYPRYYSRLEDFKLPDYRPKAGKDHHVPLMNNLPRRPVMPMTPVHFLNRPAPPPASFAGPSYQSEATGPVDGSDVPQNGIVFFPSNGIPPFIYNPSNNTFQVVPGVAWMPWNGQVVPYLSGSGPSPPEGEFGPKPSPATISYIKGLGFSPSATPEGFVPSSTSHSTGRPTEASPRTSPSRIKTTTEVPTSTTSVSSTSSTTSKDFMSDLIEYRKAGDLRTPEVEIETSTMSFDNLFNTHNINPFETTLDSENKEKTSETKSPTTISRSSDNSRYRYFTVDPTSNTKTNSPLPYPTLIPTLEFYSTTQLPPGHYAKPAPAPSYKQSTSETFEPPSDHRGLETPEFSDDIYTIVPTPSTSSTMRTTTIEIKSPESSSTANPSIKIDSSDDNDSLPFSISTDLDMFEEVTTPIPSFFEPTETSYPHWGNPETVDAISEVTPSSENFPEQKLKEKGNYRESHPEVPLETHAHQELESSTVATPTSSDIIENYSSSTVIPPQDFSSNLNVNFVKPNCHGLLCNSTKEKVSLYTVPKGPTLLISNEDKGIVPSGFGNYSVPPNTIQHKFPPFIVKGNTYFGPETRGPHIFLQPDDFPEPTMKTETTFSTSEQSTTTTSTTTTTEESSVSSKSSEDDLPFTMTLDFDSTSNINTLPINKDLITTTKSFKNPENSNEKDEKKQIQPEYKEIVPEGEDSDAFQMTKNMESPTSTMVPFSTKEYSTGTSSTSVPSTEEFSEETIFMENDNIFNVTSLSNVEDRTATTPYPEYSDENFEVSKNPFDMNIEVSTTQPEQKEVTSEDKFEDEYSDIPIAATIFPKLVNQPNLKIDEDLLETTIPPFDLTQVSYPTEYFTNKPNDISIFPTEIPTESLPTTTVQTSTDGTTSEPTEDFPFDFTGERALVPPPSDEKTANTGPVRVSPPAHPVIYPPSPTPHAPNYIVDSTQPSISNRRSTVTHYYSQELTVPPAYPSNEPVSVPNRIRGKTRIVCKEEGLEFGATTIFPFTGEIFAKDHKRIAACSKNFTNEENPTIFLPFTECGVRNAGQQSQRSQYHLQVVVVLQQIDGSSSIQSYMAQCVHQKIHYSKQSLPRRIDEAFEELRLVPIKIEQQAIVPSIDMQIIIDKGHDGFGPEVSEVDLGMPLAIRWKLTPASDSYGFHIYNCYVEDNIGGIQMMLIDEAGCSSDSTIVSHPHYHSNNDMAVSRLWAFKVPDHSKLKIHCDVRICSEIAPSGNLSSCAMIPSPPFCPDVITSPPNSILFDGAIRKHRRNIENDVETQTVRASLCLGKNCQLVTDKARLFCLNIHVVIASTAFSISIFLGSVLFSVAIHRRYSKK